MAMMRLGGRKVRQEGETPMPDRNRSNMPPADELELVRAEIKRLRAREAELRAAVLEDGAEPGQDWRVEVVEQRRRTLDRTSLPPEISGDPRYWKERVARVVKTVSVRARSAPAPVGPRRDEEDA
jgi:hypothetical protein